MEKSGVSTQESGLGKVKNTISKINRVINTVGTWLFRLRKPVMAAPVVYYALKLAAYNSSHLPEQVGMDLQSTASPLSYLGTH